MLGLQIQRNTLLATVKVSKIETFPVLIRAVESSVLTLTGYLNFYDLCAEVGKNASAVGTCKHLCEVKDCYILKRFMSHHF